MADKAGNIIPKDYDQFVELYYTKIYNQVLKFKLYGDPEDITQEVVMQFVAGDYLNIYSSKIQSQKAQERYEEQMRRYASGELVSKPKLHKGMFSSFLWEFTKVRLLGLRDKANKKTYYEGVSANAQLKTNDDSAGVTLLEFCGRLDKEYDSIELKDMLVNIYDKLSEYTIPTDTRDLPELFYSIVVDTFVQPGGFNREKYAAAKEITVSAVSMQVRDLREYLVGFGLSAGLKSMLAARRKFKSREIW